MLTTGGAPKFLRKSGQKLGKLQRKLSHKKKGSANRRKAKAKVAQCHEKFANQRKDFLHKESYHLVTGHKTIVRNMAQNRYLAVDSQ